MSVESALQALRFEPKFMRNVARWATEPAREPRYAPFPAGLDARLVGALEARGVRQIYTHQADAVAAGLRGEHVAVVTPAASGKTLCYNLPVLHHLLANPSARALYLYPTKALAQDQLAELSALLELMRSESGSAGEREYVKSPIRPLSHSPAPSLPTCATYDGDTPSTQRTKIRDGARIVLSNPDMLHAGILPHHPRWAPFFANLAAVVVDEMHMYRGVFGSHVANVLRRLRRICRFYGSEPQFFLASATIANPEAVAQCLVEAPVTVIGPERNGAPQGEKEILFYNPPLVDPALGIRRSSNAETAELAAHFLAHDVQTIVFARARQSTELILTYVRQDLAAKSTPDSGHAVHHSASSVQQSVRGYRSGYLPTERREIERGLRAGAVRAVVATNALELGIDIGQLEAALLAGYPGTIASTRQQMGRAGRRQGVSAGVLVATAEPLDQYLIAHPDYLLKGTPEHARLNPDNGVILAGHLACAAAELPLEDGETLGRRGPTAAPDPVPGLLEDLVEVGKLYRAGGRYFWGGEGTPAMAISLRSSSPDRVVIQSQDAAGKPQVIGEVERSKVPSFVYEGAVYLHEGASYLVDRLDWEAGIAAARPADVDFYTRPSIGIDVEVLEVKETSLDEGRRTKDEGPTSTADRRPLTTDDRRRTTDDHRPPTADRRLTTDDRQLTTDGDHPSSFFPLPSSFHLSWGDVRVVAKATGYRILRRGNNELLGYGQIDLPEQAIETQACWLALSEALIEQLKAEGLWFSDPNDYGPNWQAQRAAARARDGFRCQGCGALEINGRQHDVHHRIPFRAFLADPSLRGDLPPDRAWEAANVLENLTTLCPSCHRRAEMSVRLRSGLGGVAALLAGVAPLFLMCDPGDLGVVVEPQTPGDGAPTITIYEQTPGGVGYAEQLYHSMPELLAAALDLVQGCGCMQGCPSCVGPVLEHDYMLDAKALAQAILEKITSA